MTIDDIQPHHCHARARRLLVEVGSIRDELGRTADTRAPLQVTNAQPRECYFEALATWHKVDRLAAEIGAPSLPFDDTAPALTAIKPGHVLQLIDASVALVESIKQRLQIARPAAEPAHETGRTPSDVLSTLVSVNRELSRSLDRPFTPSDVHRVVWLASRYAARLGGSSALAAFEHGKQPKHCYERLLACHQLLTTRITARGQAAMAARMIPPDILPGDVFDLANLVLGELTFLHALTPDALPVHAFEPMTSGYRLPAHVDQLARTLEAQLMTIG